MSELSRERELLQLLVRFATTLVEPYQAEPALSELLLQVPRLLEVDSAGVMLEDEEGDLRFVAASDEMVRLIEGYQVETGEGPCVMAYETGAHVIIDDLEGETPFPAFAKVALAGGLRAVHSFPMVLESHRVGALNLYRSEAGALPEDGIQVGQLFADLATSYLFNARRTDDLSRQVAGLQQRIGRDGVVDQAKGMLMAAAGLDEEGAFQHLRARARSERRRLHDVAEDLVSGAMPVEALLAD